MRKVAFFTILVCFGIIFTQLANAQSTPKELVKQLLKDDPSTKDFVEGMSFNQIVNMVASIKVDLNGDKSVEYIVSGIGCGNANCPTWIYRKSGSKYIQIPVENDLSAASVEAKQTKTNGFRDLMAKTHAGAGDGSILIYKYNGSKYLVKECFDVVGGYTDRSGNYHFYKKPKVSKSKCN